jgi:glutamine phosphoribosylpyrophosphate amidotransferase
MLKKEKAAKINPIMAHTGAIINKSMCSHTLQSKSQIILENFNTNNLTSSFKNQSQFGGCA